ncbi:class I SAM-dependent methyltransferase [uncultured Microbulbifer sp.]|uniref:class I SAM-dependent DNA methyltransferase n=1 Tax=uncultured Microbulbifer sp. TaxID=348147 RepID=UPI002613DB5F|nr:class I SAM-dependent methyltransferase [uncultured Microbulbifer sp.]
MDNRCLPPADPYQPHFHGFFRKLRELDIFDDTPGCEDMYGAEHAAFYDLFAADYVGDIPLFERYLPSAGGARVLDLGCGSGRIGFPLANKGHFVDGLELSQGMLQLAERRLHKEPADVQSRLRFIQKDMSDFDLGSQYDLIVIGATSISLLLLPEQRQNLLECAYYHLKPGSHLIFDILNHSKNTWHSDVWSKETDDGMEVAIVSQEFYPERGVFTFNMLRESIDWDGNTRRTLGTSTKAMLMQDEILTALHTANLKVVEQFEHLESQFFVATKK